MTIQTTFFGNPPWPLSPVVEVVPPIIAHRDHALGEDDLAKLRAMKSAGKTVKQIQDAFKISKTTAFRAINYKDAYRTERSDPYYQLMSLEDRNKFTDTIARGVSLSTAAIKFGISRSTAYRVLNGLGAYQRKTA